MQQTSSAVKLDYAAPRLLAGMLAAIVLLPSSLRAQTIVNGDFETAAEQFTALPGYLSYGSNPSAIPGWVGGSGIDPIASGEAPRIRAVPILTKPRKPMRASIGTLRALITQTSRSGPGPEWLRA